MSLPRRDDGLHTYGEYLTWSEDARYELIDGVAYLMAPALTLEHQEVTGEIFFQLRRALENRSCRVFVALVDVRIPKAEETDEKVDTVVQPDVLVVCDPLKLDRCGVRGAPDLVVEVVSPATAGHDHIVKRRVYERAGVREYWLVQPRDRIVTVYRWQGEGFGKPEVYEMAGRTPVTVLSGMAIEWEPLIQRLPQPEP